MAGPLRSRLDDLLADRRLPHEAPDLEAMLPEEVAGRRLATWSVTGLDYLRGGPEGEQGVLPLLESEQAAFEETAASLAVEIDEYAMAVAGRSDVEADPPYFVFAHRIKSVPAVMLGPGQTVDRPDAGPWSLVTLGGRTVLVGTEAMVDQTEHMRGRPYLYDVGDVRFTVFTDDEAWALEALARLCPDPVAEQARSAGGWVELPEWGFRMAFPPGWIVAQVSDASRAWMDRWADPAGLQDTVLMAQRSGAYECSIVDITRYAESPPAASRLADLVDAEAVWAGRDLSVVDFDVTYLRLPAGRTAAIDRHYRDGTDNRDYLFTDRSRWSMLSCSSNEPPADRWLSIAETFEFLPHEAVAEALPGAVPSPPGG
jgi:hypothetical protein